MRLDELTDTALRIVSEAERYHGVIEPGSRRRYDQRITITGRVVAYHATHAMLGLVLTDREVKTYNSMGTWLTSNHDMALKMYGRHVQAYLVPNGNYLLAKRRQEMWDLVLNCLPIIEKTVGKQAADHLARYPLNAANIKFMSDLRAWARDKIKALGANAASQSVDGMIVELLRWNDRDKLNHYKMLDKSQDYYRQVCLNRDYCHEFRSMMLAAGIRGFIFNHRHWDNSPEPQTIFLVFHNEDLRPLVADHRSKIRQP